MIDWDEVKREDMEADARDDLTESHKVCDICGEDIDEGEVYYDIDNTKICEECINGYKNYA